MNEKHHTNLLKARELVVSRRRAAVSTLVDSMDTQPNYIDQHLEKVAKHQEMIDVLDVALADEARQDATN